MTAAWDDVVEAVTANVARARGETSDRLADRLDADLTAELGFDSIEVLGIWAELERFFPLSEGELAVSQAITIRTIAQVLTALPAAKRAAT